MQRVHRARGTSGFPDSGAQWGSPHFTLQCCLSLVTYPVLGAGTQQIASLPLLSGEGLRPKAGTECAMQIGRGRAQRMGGWVEGVPTKASWPGRWRHEPVPGQGSELLTEPCSRALAGGGKAEQRNGILNQLVPVHTCTHIYMHSYHTHVPQAHGHVHTYVRTHTHGSFKGLTSSFRIPTLGCSSPAEKEDKGTFPAHLPPPTSREERAWVPGGRPRSPSLA